MRILRLMLFCFWGRVVLQFLFDVFCNFPFPLFLVEVLKYFEFQNGPAEMLHLTQDFIQIAILLVQLGNVFVQQHFEEFSNLTQRALLNQHLIFP